jgi:hypothetical protein
MITADQLKVYESNIDLPGYGDAIAKDLIAEIRRLRNLIRRISDGEYLSAGVRAEIWPLFPIEETTQP